MTQHSDDPRDFGSKREARPRVDFDRRPATDDFISFLEALLNRPSSRNEQGTTAAHREPLLSVAVNDYFEWYRAASPRPDPRALPSEVLSARDTLIETIMPAIRDYALVAERHPDSNDALTYLINEVMLLAALQHAQEHQEDCGCERDSAANIAHQFLDMVRIVWSGLRTPGASVVLHRTDGSKHRSPSK